MTRHDDSVPLRHMRDHAAEAIALARGRTRADLETDRLFALGLTKLVEIIGEAAGRVSDSTCNAHPNIPWGHIIGTRNRLVHGYDQVDYNILWQIVSVELRPLIDLLDGILKNSGGKEP